MPGLHRSGPITQRRVSGATSSDRICTHWSPVETCEAPDRCQRPSVRSNHGDDSDETITRSIPDHFRLPSGHTVNVELDRVEALELLAMVLAHLNDAENRREMSARVPLLLSLRDKLVRSLQEEP